MWGVISVGESNRLTTCHTRRDNSVPINLGPGPECTWTGTSSPQINKNLWEPVLNCHVCENFSVYGEQFSLEGSTKLDPSATVSEFL